MTQSIPKKYGPLSFKLNQNEMAVVAISREIASLATQIRIAKDAPPFILEPAVDRVTG
jgi:hypothetical protein